MCGRLKCLFVARPVKKCGPGWESVRQGEWGEEAAARYLRSLGWMILGRRVRPCVSDRRCEIDIVARRPAGGGVVFVEVKTHKRHSDFSTRLWGVDRRKRGVLLRACANWLAHERWLGNYRFDVIEVYGEEGAGPPEIDHIENVKLFGPNWRFRRASN